MDASEPLKKESPALPLGTLEFEGLMAALLGKVPHDTPWAVAVSGGADSLALTLLLHDWTRAHGGSLTALTVDHSLRKDSALEAAQVGHWLTRYGISHTILTASKWNPHTRIQEKARTVRHHLLETYCALHGIEYLFFGHHLQDQWETFIHRLSHKSGLDGLTCMRPVSRGHFVTKCRPFLDIPKARLIQTLRVYKQPYVEDPSNSDGRFFRSEIRASSGSLTHLGLTPEAIRGTIHKLRNIQESLEILTSQAYDKTTKVSPLGYGSIDLENLVSFPREIARRLFESLCLRIFPRPYPPQSTSFDPLLEILYPQSLERHLEDACLKTPHVPKNKDATDKLTLSVQGTLFFKEKNTLWVMRAPLRKKSLPSLTTFPSSLNEETASPFEESEPLPSPQMYLWDHRFLIKESTQNPSHEKPNHTFIAPLGKKGLLALKKQDHPLEDLPTPIYETLLALWKDTQLLSVPNLTFGLEAWNTHLFGGTLPLFINRSPWNKTVDP